MARNRRMDWDRVAREERAREHGTEPASRDLDDRTPEERKAQRRPISAKAREIIERARRDLDNLSSRYKRLDIEQRAQESSRYRKEAEQLAHRAIAALPAGTADAAAEEIRERLWFAMVDLEPPPPERPRLAPKSKTSTSRAKKRQPAGTDAKPPKKERKPTFDKQTSVGVSATRAAGALTIAWTWDGAPIDEWIVIVKDQHTEITRRKLAGPARSVTIYRLPRDITFRLRLFGRAGDAVLATGSCKASG